MEVFPKNKMVQPSRVDITKAEEKFVLLKRGEFDTIEKIPDDVEEIKKNPIAKPLLEYIKQRKILTKILQQNLNYLKPLEKEYDRQLQIDYNENMDIVRVFKQIKEILERNNVCLNEAEEVAEKTLVEVYTIYEKEKREVKNG